jgi:hypothetical protein
VKAIPIFNAFPKETGSAEESARLIFGDELYKMLNDETN